MYHGNTTKNHGNITEMPRKITENHGKPRKTTENHGKSRKISEGFCQANHGNSRSPALHYQNISFFLPLAQPFLSPFNFSCLLVACNVAFRPPPPDSPQFVMFPHLQPFPPIFSTSPPSSPNGVAHALACTCVRGTHTTTGGFPPCPIWCGMSLWAKGRFPTEVLAW